MQPRSIQFTQYLRPNGTPVPQWIIVPDEVADRADKIIAAGLRFECELLTTGQVSLTITSDKSDVDIRVVQNGPGVPAAVHSLVMNFDMEGMGL